MPFNEDLPADGTKPWGGPLRAIWGRMLTFLNGLESSLRTKASSTDLSSGLSGKVNTATYTAGMANKADLVGGVIPTSQLPAVAITDLLGSVATQAAMLALVGQKGDWAIRTDLGSTWVITGDDPTKLASWTELKTPAGGGGAVSTVNGQTGTVVLGPSDIGLSKVNNTTDAEKPISIATKAALDTRPATMVWDKVARAYSPRPAGAAAGSRYLVIDDPTATPPPPAEVLVGDIWTRIEGVAA